MILMLWSMAFPVPYMLVILLLITLPVIWVLVFPTRKGFVLFPLFLSSLNLAYRAWLDSEIPNWEHFWLPFGLFTFFVFVVLFFMFPVLQRIKWLLLLLLPLCAAYSYGVTINLNSLFDYSAPTTFQTKVIQTRTTHSVKGGTGYLATLLPFGPVAENKEFNVGLSFYNSHPVGSPVTITLKKGLLGIPWYFINDRYTIFRGNF